MAFTQHIVWLSYSPTDEYLTLKCLTASRSNKVNWIVRECSKSLSRWTTRPITRAKGRPPVVVRYIVQCSRICINRDKGVMKEQYASIAMLYDNTRDAHVTTAETQVSLPSQLCCDGHHGLEPGDILFSIQIFCREVGRL